MKKVFIIWFLLSCTAFAKTTNLDDKLASINVELNPSSNGMDGYQIEYRQEMGHGWINITKVTRKCALKGIFYLENGKILAKNEEVCIDKIDAYTDCLFQIVCKTKTEAICKKKLAKELSARLIRQIVTNNITESIITDR